MTTGLIFDIILAAIFIAITLDGYRKGLVKSLLGLASMIIAVVCAAAFTPALSSWMNENYVGDAVRETVTSGVTDTINNATDSERAEKLFSMIDKYVLSDSDDKALSYSNEILESGAESGTVERVCAEISDNIAKPLCNSAAFFIIFILAGIVVRIAACILDNILKLPVLKQANKLLGLVMGLLCAIITLMILSRVFVCILPWLSGATDGKISVDTVEGSYLLSFFSKFNIFKEIIKDITAFM